jgi:hypothetical protein
LRKVNNSISMRTMAFANHKDSRTLFTFFDLRAGMAIVDEKDKHERM